MAHGRVHEAAIVMEGQVISGRGETEWRGAALDSRTVQGGELFFALPGDRTDGHQFVAHALRRGASAAVVHQAIPEPVTGSLIRVDDTLAGLHRLTREVRSHIPRRLVGVTGSVGKTTTKEILAALLARRFRVACNPGNLNNLLGFPIALLGIPEDTELMVAEMGMSSPGELSRISRLGRPDVAVLINVRPVHLEFFGSLRAIAEAKAELLDGLAPDGLVVANRADAEVVRIAKRHEGRVVWFAVEGEADYRIADVRSAGDELGSRFRLIAAQQEQEILLPLHGRYNLENFLAAAACAACLGVSLEEIADATREVRSPPMRGVVHRLQGGRIVVDDSYNSNPSALCEALRSAAELPGSRRWAVLGEMLELGQTAGRLHQECGRRAARLGFSPVIGVGELAKQLVRGADDGGAKTRWYEDAATAATEVPDELRVGDVVLVKGSRGVGLEIVVAALLSAAGEQG